MKSERKELNKKNEIKKFRKSVDTKNVEEENVKLPNLENKKSKKSEIKEKFKSDDILKNKLKTTPVDELIDETIKDASVNSSKKLKSKNAVNESKKKLKNAVNEPRKNAADEPKNRPVKEPKKKAVDELRKKSKNGVDELIDETLSEINIVPNNDIIEGVEDETMINSIDKPKKVASVKKNKKSTKNATKSSKKAVDEFSNKEAGDQDTKPIKKAIDVSFDNPSKKIKENANVSNKTDRELSNSNQLKEEDKTNLSNKKTDDVYKLKISKNSIKMKNIESIYPNNIGVEETKTSFLILYKNAKTAKKDLRINEKYKFYNDKLIISNFSYKENEESIKKFLSDLGEVVDISLEKNKDDVFTGKAVVTFESSVKIDKELKLNNKILRVERIRKQVVNDKRIFIGRIDMNLSIMDIRKVIKEAGARITDVRIRYEKDTHKNIGYGHLSFKTREDAIKFENNFQNIKKTLGPHSFYEYAKEKFMAPRKK